MKITIVIVFAVINFCCYAQLDSSSIVGEYCDTTCFHHCSYTYLEIKETGHFVFRGSDDYKKCKRKGTWNYVDEKLTLLFRNRKGSKVSIIYQIVGDELWIIDEETGKPWEFKSLVKVMK